MFFSNRMLVTVAALALGGAGLWGIFSWMSDDSSEGIAVIQADNSPYKSRPEDAQGLDIPHQDKMIFNAQSSKPGEIENLMPAPEQPAIENAAGETAMLSAEPLAPAPATPASAPADAAKSAEEALGRAVEPPGTPLGGSPAKTAASSAFDVAKAEGQKVADQVVNRAQETVQKAEVAVEAAKVEPAKVEAVTAPLATEEVSKIVSENTPEAKKTATSVPSMAMEPVARMVEKASPSGGRFQLASFADRASAQRGINQLAKKYADSLQGADLSIVEGMAKGKRVYRVQGDSDQAGAICNGVKAMGGSCMVVR